MALTQPLTKSYEEIENWLTYKKVAAAKRLSYKDAIDTLANAISEGSLSIDDKTFAITQKLQFPAAEITSLTFKPRLTLQDIKTKTATVKPSDSDGRMMAYVSALTDVSAGELSKMDTEDYSICQSIAVFFI